MELIDNTLFRYGACFIACLYFSVVLNRVLLRFARNLGSRNKEEERWSSAAKPAVGGLSLFLVFMIGSIAGLIFPHEFEDSFTLTWLGLFGASSVGFLIGLADDAYNTRPLLKLLGQIGCGLILVLTGIVIPVTPYDGVNWAFTMFWVVGLMNSINMLDNMDGITGGISLGIVTCMATYLLLGSTEYDPRMIILIGVSAGIIGFLFFNWHPARMYMGDSGSQFLGVFLAGFSILVLWQEREPTTELIQIKQFLLPLLVFIMPLIDTTTVFMRRLARRQSPFVGGRDHTTHHLAYVGVRDGNVAWAFAIISFQSALFVYLLFLAFQNWHSWYNWLAIGYFVVMFVAFQAIYEIGRRRNAAKS